MRNRLNWMILAFVVALTAFSVIVVWPGAPKRYLPDFVPWPEGNGLKDGGFERGEMRLGLDLKGGTYVLLEADTSRLPPGTDISDALDGVKDVLERRVNAFGVSETEITREGSLRFEQITGELVGLPMGIFLDGEIIGAPTVQDQITGGQSVITGQETDEARTLAILLN